MRYKLFGRSGLRVSELCLGTLTFGNSPGIGADAMESRAIFDAFADAGGNFIDTAHLYEHGLILGEELIGEFIRTNRDHFIVSTKYALSFGDDLVRSGSSRKNMMRCVDESLTRLRTDHIDVYWLHYWDSSTPLEEILRGFDDLVSSGKVHYVAISDTPAWQVSRAVMLSELRGWSRFCGIQAEYNLIERTAERELLPMARELGLAVCVWSPLAGGRLSGKYGLAGSSNEGRHADGQLSPREIAIAGAVVKIAKTLGCTPSQVALAALRKIGGRNQMIPIVGARTVSQIKENLASIEIDLDAEQVRHLDEISSIEPGFPDTISSGVRALAFGGKETLLDRLS